VKCDDASEPLEPNVKRGPTDKTTTHGPARVLWGSSGEPVRAWNVLLEDGSRVDAERYLWRELWRFWSDTEQRWIGGILDLAKQDVSFHPTQDDPYDIDTGGSLLRDALASPELRAFLQTNEAAVALYRVLQRGEWQDLGTGEVVRLSSSEAGEVVAALRGRGEYWADFPHKMPTSGSIPSPRARTS
jgi:hypothetical protein